MKRNHFYTISIQIVIALFLLISNQAICQQPQKGERLAQLQGLKIDFINRYLQLTPADSGFWRVYTPYNFELKQARMKSTDDIIGLEEQVLAIRKKYQPEFRKALGSEERVQKVYTVDREFNKLVREEMQKRAGRMRQ
ncbi:MAG: hypothetical protein FGM61_01970 [Sediminibacterium sp.]|nr:hypothetical protein [Sediminibacterium sp.]